MPDIQEWLDGARLRELPVPVCLDGVASAELEELQAELDSLGEWVQSSIGEQNPAVAMIGRIEAAREQVRAGTRTFLFRALGHLKYSALLAAHPAPPGAKDVPYDPATFLPALLERCCAEPALSGPQVMALLDQVNDGQARQLFAAALAVNEELSPLPF